MISSFPILSQINATRRVTMMVFVSGLALLIAWPVLSFYFRPFFHVYLTVLVLPFVIRIIGRDGIANNPLLTKEGCFDGSQSGVVEKGPIKSSLHINRYGIVSLVCFALFIWLKIHLLFFTGFCFLFFYLIETAFGKINNLPVVLVLMTSPLTVYLLELIGYPMRIQLANTATQLLQLIFEDVNNQGNIIFVNGFECTVDKACAGLRMITTGLITAIALSGIYERQFNKTLSFLSVFIMLAISFMVIVLANLIRILLLIIFQSPPDNWGHELIGGIAYAAFILPILFMVLYAFVRWIGKPRRNQGHSSIQLVNKKHQTLLLFSIFILMMIVRVNPEKFQNLYVDPSFETIQVEGYEGKVLGNGVLKLHNKEALIYLKPPQPFYSADHTPLVCWRGSGYTFKSEKISEVKEGFVVNTGLLVKENDELHTAWWYDNNVSNTHNHFTWRWRQVKKEPGFRLVNVTSDSYENLICEILKWKENEI